KIVDKQWDKFPGQPMFIGEYTLILTSFPLKITTCYTKNCKRTLLRTNFTFLLFCYNYKE
ncbi:MAG: hypothetical protein QMC93_00290, partial [Patescibacteria group bacterium]|nr:hypothetical protein [Patescibacteria group bacterium]